MSHINDSDLADALVQRLNDLLQAPGMGAALFSLIEARVPVSSDVAEHPTVQCCSDGTVGFLGMLNGLTGALPSGKFKGWGYIGAVVETDNTVSSFKRTDCDEAI